MLFMQGMFILELTLWYLISLVPSHFAPSNFGTAILSPYYFMSILFVAIYLVAVAQWTLDIFAPVILVQVMASFAKWLLFLMQGNFCTKFSSVTENIGTFASVGWLKHRRLDRRIPKRLHAIP